MKAQSYMKLRILHLSDLHLKKDNVSQDIVLSSLLKKIEGICNEEDKPNILIITGDIAYSGKPEEYNLAKTFIDKACQLCEIETERIFIIPGNHDVDRSKIDPTHLRWWYNFSDENSLLEILTSDIAFPTIRRTTDAYYEFLKNYMTGKSDIGQFGEYVSEVPFGEDGVVLKVVGLNSAIFCGYNGDDDKKLALGLLQVTNCEKQINVNSEIVITCVHHPFECFHACEKPSISVLERFSDIILSGHVHKASNSFHRGGNSGETIFITSGAAYEKRTSQNGFNIIELDSNGFNGNVVFYKYMPEEHLWIRNKDLNAQNDGVFPFEIKKNLRPKLPILLRTHTSTAASNRSRYQFVLAGNFDEMDRDKFKAIEAQIKFLFNDVNGAIIKMEKSSIKIYFETGIDTPPEFIHEVKQIHGMELLQFSKVDTDIELDMSISNWNTNIRPDFLKSIENPGATFTHSRAQEDLKLKDLFVSPNLKVISLGENAKEKVEKIISSDNVLIKVPNSPKKIVIYGSDSAGKSTLLKWWYGIYYRQGYIPVLIDGNTIKDISIDQIKRTVQREIKIQYETNSSKIEQFEIDRIIIMIDDFHKIRFTKSKFKTNLISNLDQTFANVILTGNDVMQYESYSSKSGGNILEDFHRYQITEFGPKLRYDLIKKWNEIGIDQLEPNELIRLNNDVERHVESIIGKNFVPSVPLYLLTILQARDASAGQKPEFSIHGFYYELLINDALNKAVKNKADISLYYNYITDYCFFLFDEKLRFAPLFIDDFLKFHKKYCEDYKIDISAKVVIETLVNSKLLSINIDTISISYKYVYYFFVARYLANNISKEIIKNKIKSLCERVHRDEFASIVMFLTHLSKDEFILNQLLENSKALFSEFAPLKLEDDVSFINDLILTLPEQVYLPLDVEKMKEEELKEKEELDLQEREFDSTKDIFEYDLDEDIKSLDALSTIIKAVKTIEILGQVTKKYWGELKAPQKFELTEETYMLGLRTLGFYFSMVGKDTEMLVEYLNHIYKKRNLNKNISKENINKASRDFIFNLCAMSTFGIIKSITNAIGYEKLAGTFEDVLTSHNVNSVRLIDTSIKLDHNKSFPWEGLKELKPETDKNYLASIILKNLVINYMYMFITSESDKQKLCALLDIKMEQLRLIDAVSTVKKEGN